jgi:hypothetical protein
MMSKSLFSAIGAIASVILAIGMFGGGVASADYAGQTYEQASANITQHGLKAVIATVVGDQLATSDCIVTSSKDSGFLDSSGNQTDKSVMLSLNCNEAVAKAGTPGNSVATPQGKSAKKDSNDAKYFATHPEWCLPGGKYRSPCKRICTKDSSLCSDDMLQAVAVES